MRLCIPELPNKGPEAIVVVRPKATSATRWAPEVVTGVTAIASAAEEGAA